MSDNAWREGHIEPPADGGMPEKFRLRVERFAQGCEVCSAMNWLCVGSDGDYPIWQCGSCGNVFEVPVIEEETIDGK